MLSFTETGRPEESPCAESLPAERNNPCEPTEPTLTFEQAAHFLDVKLSFLKECIENGELKEVNVRGQRLVTVSSVDVYEKKQYALRKQGLYELMELTYELGLYED